jgi:hypothetical protein
MTMHRSAFVKELRQELPSVESWLVGYRDNLTFEMMRYRQFTEDAITRGDMATVRRSFQFLAKAFATGNRHVRNSIVVSFLEHLAFVGSNGQAAEKLLPGELSAERTHVLAALRRMSELPRKRPRRRGAA